MGMDELYSTPDYPKFPCDVYFVFRTFFLPGVDGQLFPTTPRIDRESVVDNWKGLQYGQFPGKWEIDRVSQIHIVADLNSKKYNELQIHARVLLCVIKLQ